MGLEARAQKQDARKSRDDRHEKSEEARSRGADLPDAVVPHRPREHDRKYDGEKERSPNSQPKMRDSLCSKRGIPTGKIMSMPIVIVIATSTIGE